MKPLKGDIVVNGKRGLDGFPGTDLESHLVKKKIEARRRAYAIDATCHSPPESYADGRAQRLPHELLRRVDDAYGLREGYVNPITPSS